MAREGKAKPQRSFFGESLHLVGKYFKSRLLVTLIVGAVCWVVMGPLVLGVKGAIPVSIFVGLANLVPYVGPFAGIAVTAVVCLVQQPMAALWMVLTLFGLQILDAVVLSPLMLGKSLGLHPIVVFIAIALGGSAFGIIGVVIATPVAAIAALAARRIRNKFREKQAAKEAAENVKMKGEGADE